MSHVVVGAGETIIIIDSRDPDVLAAVRIRRRLIRISAHELPQNRVRRGQDDPAAEDGTDQGERRGSREPSV